MHLHLRNHRTAEGGQRQPPAPHAVEPLVRRPDRRAARGSHVQLPAALPQRRRRGRRPARRSWAAAPWCCASASPPATFWQDVVASAARCFSTSASCAAICSTPRRTRGDGVTQLRLACGNGLRAEVWTEFQQALPLFPQILEYYAATEGNFSLYNCEGRAGAIGRIPPFLAHRVPVALVKFDVDAGAPLRDASGRCMRCGPDEPGEAIGQILAASGATRFEGYTDPAASAQQGAARRVRAGRHLVPHRRSHAPGRAGIFLLRRPRGRHLPLEGRERLDHGSRGRDRRLPRTSSTRRCTALPCRTATGAPGMAALAVSEDFDLPELRPAARGGPAGVRPAAVPADRAGALELTGTFKQRKQELALEGYDLARIADPLVPGRCRSGGVPPARCRDQRRRLVAGELRAVPGSAALRRCCRHPR